MSRYKDVILLIIFIQVCTLNFFSICPLVGSLQRSAKIQSLKHFFESIDVNESSTKVQVNVSKRFSGIKNDLPLSQSETKKPKEIRLISWRWDAVGTYFLISIFLLIAAGVKICYHHSYVLNTHIPESCVLITLGTVAGLLLYVTDLQSDPHVPKFTSELFFYILLPPIILESAYSLHDKIFFNNIGTIILYAGVGTLMNVFLIGTSLYVCSHSGVFGNLNFGAMELLTFATLISAVDPVAVLAIFQEVNVNKALYFLVFGESLLNDAVVITMYNMVTTFAAADAVEPGQIVTGVFGFLTVSGGGLIIGIFHGILTSLITRFTEDIRVVEPLIVIVLAYLSYLSAELFHFSGIISLIGCGLIQDEYARHNISKKSYTTIKYMTKTCSSISDVIIFLFLGMVLIRDDHIWNTSFVLLTTIFCILFRFTSVFTLTYCANNFFQRVRIVNFEEQLLMAYGGLRGAIAFSLAIMLDPKHIKQAELFITTTLFIILVTVFVLGSTTKPIVKLLRVQIHVKQEAKLFNEINYKVMETVMASIEETAGQRSTNFWNQKLRRFNNNYFKKVLIRGGAGNATGIKVAYDKIYKDQLPSNQERLKSICEVSTSQAQPECPKRNADEEIIEVDETTIEETSNAATANPAVRRKEPKLRLITKSLPKIRSQSTQVTPVSSLRDYLNIRKPTEQASLDCNKALADAFSKSAYYQLAGSFRAVEDPEQKMSKEIEKKSRWVNAKSKLVRMKSKRDSIISDGSSTGVVTEAFKMHSIVQEALKREHDRQTQE